MQSLIPHLLNEANLEFEKHVIETGHTAFFFEVNREMGRFPVMLVSDEESNTLSAKISSPIKVKETSRIPVARLLEQFRFLYHIQGEFVLDDQTGEVHHQKDLKMGEGVSDEASFSFLMDYFFEEVDHYLPFIVGVAYSNYSDFSQKIGEVYEPGTWVIFTNDQFIGRERYIVEGMLGKVVDNKPDWEDLRLMGILSANMKRGIPPKISTFIQPNGTNINHGFFNEAFVPLGRKPTKEELEKSEELRRSSFDIMQKKRGYSGYVKVGTKVVAQEKLFRELSHSSERVTEWLQEEGQEKHVKGTLNRIKKVLFAFKNHPQGDRAVAMAEAISAESLDSEEVSNLMQSVRKWIEDAREVARLKSQEERMHKRRKKLP